VDRVSGERPPLLHAGRTFEEQPVGFAFRTARRTVTEHDLGAFVALCGFSEGLFLDASGAAEAGYAGRLVPGALVFSFAEGLVVSSGIIAGTGMAYLGSPIDVLGPTYVGDTIEVHVTVTANRVTSAGGRGIVTTRNDVVNQRGEIVLRYAPSRMVRGRA
jgi:acyl dehydratase